MDRARHVTGGGDLRRTYLERRALNCGFSGEFEFWAVEFIGQPHYEVHCAAYAESPEHAGDWVRCANSSGAKRWYSSDSL